MPQRLGAGRVRRLAPRAGRGPGAPGHGGPCGQHQSPDGGRRRQDRCRLARVSLSAESAAPGATTFGERVPLLTSPDDPLVGVVETLIQVADARSRRERAHLLVKRLEGIEGLSAVPILSSLRLRADWAADERTLASLT